MSIQQLSREAMALPLAERAMLAQALWASIEDGLPVADERTALAVPCAAMRNSPPAPSRAARMRK